MDGLNIPCSLSPITTFQKPFGGKQLPIPCRLWKTLLIQTTVPCLECLLDPGASLIVLGSPVCDIKNSTITESLD